VYESHETEARMARKGTKMIHPQLLIGLFTYNYQLIERQLRDITHEQSLRQPPYPANCMNWLLGHVISSRNRALIALGGEPIWSAEVRQPYRSGSPRLEPTSAGIIHLDQLRSDFTRSQAMLVQRLEQATADDMLRLSGYKDNTIGESLAYYHFHEAHHVGQILYLAPALGVEGVWLP
jgi:uncharacterized damage-inducible protein DinB